MTSSSAGACIQEASREVHGVSGRSGHVDRRFRAQSHYQGFARHTCAADPSWVLVVGLRMRTRSSIGACGARLIRLLSWAPGRAGILREDRLGGVCGLCFRFSKARAAERGPWASWDTNGKVQGPRQRPPRPARASARLNASDSGELKRERVN